MVRKDGAEARKERIKQTSQFVHASLFKSNGSIPLSKTAAYLQAETGLTRERIMEYLQILQELGQFVIDEKNNRILKADQS